MKAKQSPQTSPTSEPAGQATPLSGAALPVGSKRIIVIEELYRAYQRHDKEFEERFGFGPCGAIATLLRGQGYGKIAYAEVIQRGDGYTVWFGHYLIRLHSGTLLDISNPFINNCEYRDIVILPDDETPELIAYGEDDEAVEFWRQRMPSSQMKNRLPVER